MSKKTPLATPDSRLKLEPGARHLHLVKTGLWLVYRRGATAKRGKWLRRIATGLEDNPYGLKKLDAWADDIEGGGNVLTFDQAVDRAIADHDAWKKDHSGPVTFAKAHDLYEAKLKKKGSNLGNVDRLREHTPAAWLDRNISSVSSEWEQWQSDMLDKGYEPSGIIRIQNIIKAALTNAAKLHKITDRPWIDALSSKDLPGDISPSRNVVLTEYHISRLILEAGEPDPLSERPDREAFAARLTLFIHVLADTGTRTKQAARLEVRDLQTGPKPKLLIPQSYKGQKRTIDRVSVPITAALALKLKAAAGNRPPAAPLLTMPNGESWLQPTGRHGRLEVPSITKPFARAVKRLRAKLHAEAVARGEDGEQAASALDGVSPYCLRHSYITRMLRGGESIIVVAKRCDTSPEIIQRHYADDITEFADELTRRLLVDFSTPPTATVTPISAAKR